MTEPGILFLGHGTRSQFGISEFMQLNSRVQKEVQQRLQLDSIYAGARVAFGHAFLELCVPDMNMTIQNGPLAGNKQIGIVPVFLFAAGHLKRDVPHLLSSLSKNRLSFVMGNPVGEEDRCIALSKTRILETGFSPETESGLVMVARGSRDPEVLQAFDRVSKKLQKELQAPHLEMSFLTGPGPSLEDALQKVRARGFSQVYVAPYLLFYGTLVTDVHRVISQWSCRYPDVLVKVTSHLGVHELLVECFTEKTLTVLRRLSQ